MKPLSLKARTGTRISWSDAVFIHDSSIVSCIRETYINNLIYSSFASSMPEGVIFGIFDYRLFITLFAFGLVFIAVITQVIKQSLSKATKGSTINMPGIAMDFLKKAKPEDLKDDIVYSRIKELVQIQQQQQMMSMLMGGGLGGGKGGGGLGGGLLGDLLPMMMLGPMMKGMGGMFGGQNQGPENVLGIGR